MKGKNQPTVLTQGCEEILRAVHFYRYMTARDVAELLYTPSSLRKVRALLSGLCGEVDFDADAYLYRFRMPKTDAGNPERVYTLGRAGREFMESEGKKVAWRARVEKLGFTQLMHNLTLTRVLVAARSWAKVDSTFRVGNMKICYELEASGILEDAKEKEEKGTGGVIPDGWILFERKGEHEGSYPVLLEIDRGTMYRERFKKHVVDRIEFVRSGAYSRMFGIEAVVIAYVAIGAAGERQEGRQKALCSWTMEALKGARRESWASVFRFASVSYGELYESGVFGSACWYRPDEKSAVRLLGA